MSERILGFVLSGSSTRKALIQLTKLGEERIEEGMLVVVKVWRGKWKGLARVTRLRVESEVFKEDFARVFQTSIEDVKKLIELSDTSVYAEIEILGLAGKPGLPPLPKPPLPGDVVTEVPDNPKDVFGVDEHKPGIIWYGSLYGYKLPLPLNIEALTMHVGVFGETGSGKSYGVGYLLELLSRIPLGSGSYEALPAIIVDANADYIDYHEAYTKGLRIGAYRRVYRFVAPSRAETLPLTTPLTIDLNLFTPREAAEMIILYKTGGFELNELQVSALERILSGLTSEGYELNSLICSDIDVAYSRLEMLSRGREALIHHQTAKAIKTALDKFHHDVCEVYKLISSKPTLDYRLIDEITEKPSLVIIDFSPDGFPGVPLQVKQLIVAYLARLLYSRFTRYKIEGKDRYLLFIIEEAQNYAPNPRTYPIGISIARDYLALIATQGRKFGICLLLISQRPAFIDPVVLSMLNTWIIHRVSPDDVNYILRACGGLPQDMSTMLTRLPRGVAIVTGQMNMLGHPTLVKVGSRSVPHRMGRTGVVEALRRVKK